MLCVWWDGDQSATALNGAKSACDQKEKEVIYLFYTHPKVTIGLTWQWETLLVSRSV